ncbi:MAG: endonuclease III [Clostridiales bacterium]|nr:endonuclease III [Clostridiales bacterium]
MFTTKEVNKILDTLEETYPEAACALNHDEVFELLVAVALSAQTTDKSVNAVTPGLFKKYPDAEALASADENELIEIIRKIGMFRTKARNLVAMSRVLVSEHDGKVPDTYDELLKLPGVGRKTANVVLSVGFGKQRIAVDTHVFRVANRIGLADEKDVLSTEYALMEAIPEARWSRTHHSLIFHGRNCCSARKPKCEACSIAGMCKWLLEQKTTK